MNRILLLRLLWSWWVIPASWVIWPAMFWFLTGDAEIKILKEFTHDNWYGWQKL